ncbi:MAG TPA: tetratricopeptide repeat protein [Tepidisphaeraceae bacterium]|nr:tetratricopeptide repeat protein [Tepidisphaeraceae bacterium]
MTSSIRAFSRFVFSVVLVGTTLIAGGCNSDAGPLPDNARKQGIKLYDSGKYTDAAGSFQNAVRQDPRDYVSFYYLGESYSALKSYQQAIQAYRSSLDTIDITRTGRLDKQFRMKIMDGLANAIAKSENREAEITSQTAGGADVAQNVLIVAKVHRLTGDADAALEAYNRATLADPKNFLAHKEYGLYLAQLGQNQQAEAMLRKAYTLNAGDQQVNDALRKLGVVPGPTIRNQ